MKKDRPRILPKSAYPGCRRRKDSLLLYSDTEAPFGISPRLEASSAPSTAATSLGGPELQSGPPQPPSTCGRAPKPRPRTAGRALPKWRTTGTRSAPGQLGQTPRAAAQGARRSRPLGLCPPFVTWLSLEQCSVTVLGSGKTSASPGKPPHPSHSNILKFRKEKDRRAIISNTKILFKVNVFALLRNRTSGAMNRKTS